MNTKTRRIAINVGAGFVPGMNAVVKGAALAAASWDGRSSASGMDSTGCCTPITTPMADWCPSTANWSRTWIRPAGVFWASRPGSIPFMSAR